MQVRKVYQGAHLSCIFLVGHNHPQGAGPHAIMKRGLQNIHLSVECHAQTLVPRLDPYLFCAQGEKIFLFTKPAEQGPQSQSDQPPSAGAVSYVKAQLSPIQTFAQANIKSLHRIFVIADKNEWRSATKFPSVHTQANIEKRISAKHCHCGPNECRPFARTQALLLLTFKNHRWVQAQARIVEKDSSVDFAHINADDAARCYRARSEIQIVRNLQISREMIERAERQNTQNLIAPDDCRGYCIDGAIAATGYDDCPVAAGSFARKFGDLNARFS